MSTFVGSINRATSLMRTPPHYWDYILIKITPEDSGCCCLKHWKTSWQTINEYIYPDGPVGGGRTSNEGDVLIHKGGEEFVLECHETGPEIVIYLGVFVATVEFIKSVADLIEVILNARKHDVQNISCLYKLKTFGNDGNIIREEEVDLKIPPSSFNTQKLENYVQRSIADGIHTNILLLIERMDSDLNRGDYAGVLHSSASIFETMGKHIVGIPSVQNQTLKSFFERYRKESVLPKEILDYIISVYEKRNIMPLAGHGSTQESTLSKPEAVTLIEITKACVNSEYKSRENPDSTLTT